jgi:yecA family protein
MTVADEIRLALEHAEDVPEDALRAAVTHAAELAPAVIAVARGMTDGVMPLPREEKLLRFGLHAMSVARETSVCRVFVALLRRPPIELEWLFGEDGRSLRVARLLLGLFDGDDEAVRAMAADKDVDADVRGGLLEALARLAWEGRASREELVALLDRLDREELTPPDSPVWSGWHTAIMLLGLTDWIERVDRAYEAGRDIPMFDREVDRKDWLERIHAAAEHPEDPRLFVDDDVVPYDDPVKGLDWSSDPVSESGEQLSPDEAAWLDLALWRRLGTETMPLEWADGYLSALAVGPERVPPTDYMPRIVGSGAVFDTPAHDAYVAELLGRQLEAIERGLAGNGTIDPVINYGMGDLEGTLWAQGYLSGVQHHEHAWEPLRDKKYLAERLFMPLLALLPDEDAPADGMLTEKARSELIGTLPELLRATWSFWHGGDHPLLQVPRVRAAKVGRNDPCPCGSGKKYKRCCGAAA